MLLTQRYSDRLEENEDGSITFTLRKAVKTADGEVGFLTLRRPTFEDVIGQSKQAGDDWDKIGWLMVRLSGIDAKAFDDIDAEDAIVLSEVIGSFFDRLPEYGAVRHEGDLALRHSERITKDDDGATLALRSPVVGKDGEVTSVTLRRPSFKEMRVHKAAGAGNLAASAKLIATLSGVGPLTLGKIDALDGLILGEIVSGFLGNFPGTGDL